MSTFSKNAPNQIDFEEADQEAELPILWDISWEEVKKCLINKVKHIARKIQDKLRNQERTGYGEEIIFFKNYISISDRPYHYP